MENNIINEQIDKDLIPDREFIGEWLNINKGSGFDTTRSEWIAYLTAVDVHFSEAFELTVDFYQEKVKEYKKHHEKFDLDEFADSKEGQEYIDRLFDEMWSL